MDAMRRAAQDGEGLFARTFKRLKDLGRRVPFAEDLLAALYCALDPTTDKKVKLILFGAAAYFLMPADAIPDVFPIIGFTDDAAVIAAAIAAVRTSINDNHRDKARETLKR
ncbi:MAG: DUF1232 domain-containing protein [Beijerinckiaceae bacterium]|nr:DUF1232 domain-containing protein [Beijerinckiaceae bacterium]